MDSCEEQQVCLSVCRYFLSRYIHSASSPAAAAGEYGASSGETCTDYGLDMRGLWYLRMVVAEAGSDGDSSVGICEMYPLTWAGKGVG